MELVRAFMAAIISQPRLAAMPIITTFLPSGYFPLSFDFRMSRLTQCRKVGDASDAVYGVQSSRRNIDRLLRELPDGDDRTENQDRVNCHLDDVAALFFRANQERVSRFVLVLWLICPACLFFHGTESLEVAIVSNDIYHRISATAVSGMSDIFVRDHVLAFVMWIFIRLREGLRFYLVCPL